MYNNYHNNHDHHDNRQPQQSQSLRFFFIKDQLLGWYRFFVGVYFSISEGVFLYVLYKVIYI